MCLCPITIKDKSNPKITYTVPCGKCAECVSKYQNDWSFRLSYESKRWKNVFFATFTYDDDHCPHVTIGDNTENLNNIKWHLDHLTRNKELNRHWHNPTKYNEYLFSSRLTETSLIPSVSRIDITKFLKRLREQYYRATGERLIMKYFICSEYGPNTLRPHYHGLFFGNFDMHTFQQYVVDSWCFGNVNDPHIITGTRGINSDIEKVTSYVAKYCSKPAEYENPYVYYGYVLKPFRAISKGIGQDFIPELKERIFRNEPAQYKEDGKVGDYHCFDRGYVEWVDQQFKIFKNGFFYSMPKYWRDNVLPQTIKYSESYKVVKNANRTSESDGDSNSVKVIKVQIPRKVVDREAALCNALDCLTEDRILEDYQRKWEEYKMQHPMAEDAEIIRSIELSRLENLDERAKRKYGNFEKYYFKNSLKYSY